MKDKIIQHALIDASHAGWSMSGLREAARMQGQNPQMADALFPSMTAATEYLADMFDRLMLEQLKNIDRDSMRIRDRIATAVQTRLDLMAPYRDGLHVVLAHWARPLRSLRAAKPLWRSADKIWVWAGDTATDYNHYTKRALLSGVMASTILFWLQDNSPGSAATRGFLDRRIDNVLTAGRLLGTLRSRKDAA